MGDSSNYDDQEESQVCHFVEIESHREKLQKRNKGNKKKRGKQNRQGK